jgi:thiamine-phosphate pyrophosphorylase
MASRAFPRPPIVCVITSSGLVPGRDHMAVAHAAVEGGARVVQLRAPELADRDLVRVASEVAALCRERGVLSIVNDRVEVALAGGADGVHLGQGDEVAGARERLGRERILGLSVGTPEQARTAETAGADYLGVTVWATTTKPEARPVGLDGLRAVATSTPLPVFGVGGVDASNAGRVMSAGAAGVAVVSAVGAAADPVEATMGLVSAVAGHRSREEAS